MVQEYRFEIWSTMPGENPSEDGDDWRDGVAYLEGDDIEFIKVSGLNFAAYTINADSDRNAKLIGQGWAFQEDWMKDGTSWRLFRKTNGWPENWIEVDAR